jgi:hypothetical protein
MVRTPLPEKTASLQALCLHADHKHGLAALTGGQNGLGAIQPLLLGKSGPSAGDLGLRAPTPKVRRNALLSVPARSRFIGLLPF